MLVSSLEQINLTQLVIVVQVYGKLCMALVDSSYSRSLSSKDVPRMFVHVTTINGETNFCGVRVVNGGNPVKVDILVTRERLLGYDLLTRKNIRNGSGTNHPTRHSRILSQ